MTTRALSDQRALTTYLRRATWGLPEGRRQELWDELEEHILTRAEHLQFTDLSPSQALAQALRELGPPARLTLGMAKVYTMPKLLIAAGAAALALSAALYAMAGGGETPMLTLPVVTQSPVKPSCVRGTKPSGDNITIVSENNGITCYTFNDGTSYLGAYLNGNDIVKAIRAQGGRATLKGNRLDVSLPGTGSGGGEIGANFTRNGQPYFDAFRLIDGVGTPLPIRFAGFAAPQVQIGAINLRFGTGEQSVGRLFYNPLYSLFISSLKGVVAQPGITGGGYFMDSPRSPNSRHRVATTLAPGEVVMLITKRAGERYMADTAEVGADRSAVLQSEASKVRFVSSLGQLGPYPGGGRINALLVRVTNIPLDQLKTGIFLPARPTSDAR
ncbi:permease prefix domain 1-containing protein [Deinococcus koreensis]|uniref:Uncharacterized protein n=1 Tax=Deinococcus koreensis TaxID=2054903 RepID=A0A2K3UUE2_9DEIO|nr:permease prefix domain 1-containing protein [Deinococcus koreensis]PNY80138.1 hypothetical protein CVO96_01110 [Deinococcus koreensis]